MCLAQMVRELRGAVLSTATSRVQIPSDRDHRIRFIAITHYEHRDHLFRSIAITHSDIAIT